jgi:hypothetical protein
VKAAPEICAKCRAEGSRRDATGRYGRFRHVGCFNAWWKAEYGDCGGPYYDWIAQLAFLAYLIVAAVLLAAVVGKAVWHLIGPLFGV